MSLPKNNGNAYKKYITISARATINSNIKNELLYKYQIMCYPKNLLQPIYTKILPGILEYRMITNEIYGAKG